MERKKKSYYLFTVEKRPNLFSYCEEYNNLFEVKCKSTMTLTIKNKNKIKYANNKDKENQIKKRKIYLSDCNTIIINYIIITLIQYII